MAGTAAAESEFADIELAIEALGPYNWIGYTTGWDVDAVNIQALEDDPDRFRVDYS